MAKLVFLVAFVVMVTLSCAVAYPNTYMSTQARELATCRDERDALARQLAAWKFLMSSLREEAAAEALAERVRGDHNKLRESMQALKPFDGEEVKARETNMGKKTQTKEFHFMDDKSRKTQSSSVDESEEMAKKSENEGQIEKKGAKHEETFDEESVLAKLQRLAALLSHKNE